MESSFHDPDLRVLEQEEDETSAVDFTFTENEFYGIDVVDSAATSIGFPIRNMHTISESGHTGDVLASIHGTIALLKHLDNMHGGQGASADDFKKGHPRLDQSNHMNYETV